jgi:hypothetical protein
MRKVCSDSHAQFLSKNMKPITSAYLLHVSGPDDYSPRQNQPVNLHVNRKLHFRLVFTLDIAITDKPICKLKVADFVLKYRALLRLDAVMCAVMIGTIVIKCFAYM